MKRIAWVRAQALLQVFFSVDGTVFSIFTIYICKWPGVAPPMLLLLGQWQTWLIDHGCFSCGSKKSPVGMSGASQVMLAVKSPPASSGDLRDWGSIPVLGRSPGGGSGNPLQYSCLENPMVRGAWYAVVYRVAKSQTQLKGQHAHTHTCTDMWDEIDLEL